MTRIKKYEEVNRTESLEELSEVIKTLADKNGMIEGNVTMFNANDVSLQCKNLRWSNVSRLPKEFGIRQQAIMLLMYKKKLEED